MVTSQSPYLRKKKKQFSTLTHKKCSGWKFKNRASSLVFRITHELYACVTWSPKRSPSSEKLPLIYPHVFDPPRVQALPFDTILDHQPPGLRNKGYSRKILGAQYLPQKTFQQIFSPKMCGPLIPFRGRNLVRIFRPPGTQQLFRE